MDLHGKKIGIVALGGGFNAVISVGMWKFFWDHKLIPSYVQLISANVFNGLQAIQANGTDELIETWLNIERGGPDSIFNIWSIPGQLWWGCNSFFNERGVEELIKKIHPRTIFNSPIDIDIVTQNESRQCELSFFNNRTKDNQPPTKEHVEKYKEVVRAAIALPGFLPPRLIDGGWHSDAMKPDFRRALAQKCDILFIFNNDHGIDPSANPNEESAPVRAVKNISRMSYDLVELGLRECQYILPHCQIRVIKSSGRHFPFNTLRFPKRKRGQKSEFRVAIDHGYEVAARAFE